MPIPGRRSASDPDLPSGPRALSTARDIDGAVLAVDDDAIRGARRDLAADGMRVKAASATMPAGLAAALGVGSTDDQKRGDGAG